MTKTIITVLVAAVIVSGITILTIPVQIADAGINPTPFKAVINKLTSLNKYFEPPAEGVNPPDDTTTTRQQLDEIQSQITQLQDTHDAWIALLR